MPHYSVSLALERNGELLVGAVYDPMLDECFTAAAGQGARLNGRPIHASQRRHVVRGSGRRAASRRTCSENSPDLLLFLEMVGRTQGIRRTGSSALNLCYVAAGRFDLYWSYSTNIWDVAAGVLILREAGGHVNVPHGRGFSPGGGPFPGRSQPGTSRPVAGDVAATITGQHVSGMREHRHASKAI